MTLSYVSARLRIFADAKMTTRGRTRRRPRAKLGGVPLGPTDHKDQLKRPHPGSLTGRPRPVQELFES